MSISLFTFTQNVNPLVKSTVMSLLLMILSRSGDVIEWYNNTKGSSDPSEVTGKQCYSKLY